jgi:hypothetical protein
MRRNFFEAECGRKLVKVSVARYVIFLGGVSPHITGNVFVTSDIILLRQSVNAY